MVPVDSAWAPPTQSIEQLRRGRHVWLWVIAGVLAFVVLCGVGIASCMNSFSHSFGSLGGPTVVKRVPIPAAACPYLRVVYVAAESAGAGWVSALDYHTTQQWRPFAVQLAPKLPVLETALLVASAHVPRPVASYFTDALHQVVIGRPPLAASQTVDDYLG